ncbi:hypothetical protein ACTAF0_00360 [Streptomyces murinus]|uniref:hypothetical protein n=1 Tax=Streptomyces murinus TaxID=33900 RepID=UPI003F480161
MSEQKAIEGVIEGVIEEPGAEGVTEGVSEERESAGGAVAGREQVAGAAGEREQADGVVAEREQVGGVVAGREQVAGAAGEREQADGVVAEREQVGGVVAGREQVAGAAGEREQADGVVAEREQAGGAAVGVGVGQEPVRPASRATRASRPLRGALRWAAALAVFAVFGASTAYGVTRLERTDVPGLGTASDGRWDYPELVRPPLPEGRPAPFASSNKATAHYADLRELVLPAPRGATADKTLAVGHGWVKTGTFLDEYPLKDDRELLGGVFRDRGLRHIAARGWTTPDGTRTRIYLLQFGTGLVAGEVQQEEFAGYDHAPRTLRGAPSTELDGRFPDTWQLPNVTHYAYDEPRPYGAEQVRQAYLLAGDVIGLVVQSRKGDASAVPFQQTVALQEELLG